MKVLGLILVSCMALQAQAFNRISCSNADGSKQYEIIVGINKWYGAEKVKVVEKVYSAKGLLTRDQSFDMNDFKVVEAVDIQGMTRGCLDFGIVTINVCKVSKDLAEESRKNQYAYFSTESFKVINWGDVEGFYVEKPLLLGQVSTGSLVVVQADGSKIYSCALAEK